MMWLRNKSAISHMEGRNQIINDTRIKYLLVGDKLYQVTHIDFSDLILEARECDLDVSDVLEEEVFYLEDFGEFRVTLRNEGGKGKVVDFGEYVKRNKER